MGATEAQGAVAGRMPRIAVVDYHKGNLRSVERGLADAGAHAVVTDDAVTIAQADGIVLPGVGAFADASASMRALGEDDAVRQAVAHGAPFLGICLGLQLAFDWGDEGCEPGQRAQGLGLLPGHCERMPATDDAGMRYKVPHVGWNDVALTVRGASCPLFAGVPDHTYFYFTHSYCAVPDDPADLLGTTTHARPFASAVGRGRVYAVQFHPEKSSTLGLVVLKNFVGIVREAMGDADDVRNEA